MTREKIVKQGAIQFEMNIAMLPDWGWVHFERWMTKMLLRGPNRNGIWVDDRQIVLPWDDDSKRSKWFLSRELFGLPFSPMLNNLENFLNGSMFTRLMVDRVEPLPGFESTRSSGSNAWEIFNLNVEQHKQRVTMKVWMYWLKYQFGLSDGKHLSSLYFMLLPYLMSVFIAGQLNHVLGFKVEDHSHWPVELQNLDGVTKGSKKLNMKNPPASDENKPVPITYPIKILKYKQAPTDNMWAALQDVFKGNTPTKCCPFARFIDNESVCDVLLRRSWSIAPS
jgi:hypothetical protein